MLLGSKTSGNYADADLLNPWAWGKERSVPYAIACVAGARKGKEKGNRARGDARAASACLACYMPSNFEVVVICGIANTNGT